mmetsp:Transcript_41342/g.47005  ORF Transcript_41342/g.47005 Transcript_41342/m.47005 type:complete len:176 (+) Transcript_41342:129-656(+)
MIHIMKPGVQQSRSFYPPPTASLVPKWKEQEMTNEPITHNNFQSSEIQQTSNYFTQEHHVQIDDELHKRSRSTPQPLTSFTPHDISRNKSSTIEAADRQQNGKRSRRNTYRAPREIKQTVTSVMGSLVGGTFEETTGLCRMRRQLSGSQLDQFINATDTMTKDDPVITRERAMSF